MAKTARRWSQRVTRESDALDLSKGVFTWKDPQDADAREGRAASPVRPRAGAEAKPRAP
jgi:Protein of unknown function (DUF3175)